MTLTSNASFEQRSVAGVIRDLIVQFGTRRTQLYRTRPAGPSQERIERYLANPRVTRDQIITSGL